MEDGVRLMIRKPLILLAGALALLFLGSCDMLFNGAYSPELAQMTAVADLAAIIPAAPASTYNLSILHSGDVEFVLLYSSASFDSTQTHLVVLSPSLKVLSMFTGNDISLLPPVGTPFNGSSAVTHLVDGVIVIGNVEAVPSPTGLTLVDKLNMPTHPVNVQLSGATIVGPATASLTWTGFGVDPTGVMSWSAYAADWSTVSAMSHPLGRQVQVVGAFTDSESDKHNVAFLVFSDGNANTLLFMQLPKSPDLLNGFPGPPLFSNPAYPTFTKSGLSQENVFMTADSIVGFDQNSQSWVRFSPSSPDTVTKLYTGNRKRSLKSAFSFAGGYYCTWDPDTRTLARYEKWW
jgi:hypothetical protein